MDTKPRCLSKTTGFVLERRALAHLIFALLENRLYKNFQTLQYKVALNMADVFKETTQAIGLFAGACEQMNRFARELDHDDRFAEARSGADIRCYDSGWRMEKWVEALLDEEQGHRACWWLELGCTEVSWLVGTSASVSHSDIDVDLPQRTTSDTSGLEDALDEAIRDLITSAAHQSDFGKEIAKLLNHG